MPSRCLAEFLGVFVIVLTGCAAIVIEMETSSNWGETPGILGHPGVALVFGLIYATMTLTYGGFSGAHFNPAITFSFWWRGKFSGREVMPYITCQISGAVIGALTLWLLFSNDIKISTWGLSLANNNVGPWQNLALEGLFSFFLILVCLRMAQDGKLSQPSAAFAVGSIMAVAFLVLGPVTTGPLNPARSLGPALIHWHFEGLWPYLVGPFLGGLAASFLSEKE